MIVSLHTCARRASSALGVAGFAQAIRLMTVLLAAVLLSVPLRAQSSGTGVLTGRVVNEGTGQYLNNAAVRIEGTNLSTLTASDGTFRISGIEPGTYQVVVSFVDLDTVTRSIVIEAGATVREEFSLTDEEYYVLGEFVVATEREGSAKAIQEQRESDTIKNIFAADSFGNMVDGNMGELLKNLPGITVDYDGEDAAAMRFRGMDPSLASVTMDGNAFATNPGSDTRTFSLRDFPVQNIEAIEVNFAPTPEQPSNTMGGSINFKTKSAFNQKGRRVRIDANLSLNTAALDFQKTPGGARTPHRKLMPGVTLGYSEAFGEERPIGVSFTANFAQRFRFNDNYDLPNGYAYNQDELEANGGIATADMQGTIASVRWRERGQANQRTALSLNLDHKLSDSTSVYLYTTWSSDEGLGSYDYMFRVNAGTQMAESNFDTMVGSNSSISVTSSVSNNNTSTFSINPGVKHQFGDLYIAYDAFLSRSEYDPDPSQNYTVSYGLGSLGLTVEGISGNATGQITQRSGDDYLELANYNTLSLTEDFTTGTDEIRGAKIDVKHPFMVFNMPLVVQAGARYNEQVRDLQRYYRQLRMTGNSESAAYGTSAEPKLQQFADPYFKNTWEFDVPIPNWVRPYSVYDYYVSNPEKFYEYEFDESNIPASAFGRMMEGDRKSKEAITAGYLMGTLQVRPELTILGGARYELTELTAEGAVYDSTDRPWRAGHKYDNVTPGSPYYGWTIREIAEQLLFSRASREKSYDKIFPNLQVKYEPLKNLILRGAVTTNMGRPDFSAIMPGDRVYDHYNLIRRNNTKLMPQEGTNYDVRMEYYLPNSGVVNLTLFKQDIRKYIYTSIYSEQRENVETGLMEPWIVETRENTGDGSNTGFEVNYRQRLGFITEALKNIEIYVAYSESDPKADYWRRSGTPIYSDNPTQEEMDEYMNSPLEKLSIPLANVVPRSGNIRLTYTGRKFSGSVAAFWRDDFMRSFNGTTLEQVMQASDLRVDLNVSYKLSQRWTSYLDWRNLTNEPDSRSIFNRTGGFYESGMIINVGLRANF